MAENEANRQPAANTDNLAEQIGRQVSKEVAASFEEAVAKVQKSIAAATADRILRVRILGKYSFRAPIRSEAVI